MSCCRSLAPGLACAFLVAALAAGPGLCATAAGSIIRSQASANYEYQGSTSQAVSNMIELRVDELLDVTLASLSPSPVQATRASLALPFLLTNAGNGSEAWMLSAEALSGGDFPLLFQGFAIDSNGDGRYDAGSDAMLASGSPTPQLSPENGTRLFVLVDVPSDLQDRTQAVLRLSARSLTGVGLPGTSFAGAGDGGGDALVGATGASASVLATIEAVRSAIDLEKSFAITDPFGGQKPVSGARVRYTLVARAIGTDPVEGAVLSDAIPQGTSYLAGTLTLDGSALSDRADADPGRADAAGIAVDLSAVPGGDSHTITFDVLVS